KHKILHRLL
nr:Chain A, Nuclear receptor coactivator 2 [Homo sapiens]